MNKKESYLAKKVRGASLRLRSSVIAPTPEETTRIIRDSRPSVILDLYRKHPEMFTEEHWNWIYTRSERFVATFASYPATPPEFLARLVSHPNSTVRTLAYYNDSTPEEARIAAFLAGVEWDDTDPPKYNGSGRVWGADGSVGAW